MQRPSRLHRPLLAVALAAGFALAPVPALASHQAPVITVTAAELSAADGWAQREDGAWTYVHEGAQLADAWLVTDTFPGAAGLGLQRYWFGPDGALVANQLFQGPDGSWYYARPEGYVVRGSYATGSGVYLADNDGRLLSPGWQVTGDFSGGELQRYYVDQETHAARTGFFQADGHQFFASPQTGRVLRNAWPTGGWAPFCDNEGVISATGWLVTEAFGQGLQRYWFDSNSNIVTSQVVDAGGGWVAYATPEGYVVRGRYADPATGLVYLADNDGRLETPGWHVTGAYDGGTLQRYYVDETTRACRTGLFTVGGNAYYGMPDTGYVLRGTLVVDGSTYVADNDGVLAATFGVTVLAADGSTQRIVSSVADGAPHLFLPAHADLSAVRLELPAFAAEGMLVSLDGTDEFVPVSNGAEVDLSGLPVSEDGTRTLRYKTSPEAVEGALRVMVSANVGAMYLTSEDPVNEGRPFVDGSPDHSAKAKGSMELVNPDGTVVYDGELSQIKGRGNSTWMLDKKPYQIKLDEKCDLLQTGNEDNVNKTWILLANAADATRLRNAVTYEFAQALGLATTPEGTPVDLYYDGEYRGSYLLSEKAEINDGRVDIHKLEDDNEEANPGVDLGELPVAQGTNGYGYAFRYVEGMADPEDITGGYLVELDSAYFYAERCWFQTSAGTFVVKEPENLSLAQMTYISEYVQAAIDATDPVRGGTGVNAAQYVDVTSFAQTYMVNQLSKNIDWQASSAYYYLPAEGDAEKRGLDHVLYAGPIWDYDTAYGVRSDGADAAEWRDPEGLLFVDAHRVWYATCPAITSEVEALAAERGNALAAALTSGGQLRSVDELAEKISASRAMDETLWGFTQLSNCVPPLGSYEENLAYLRGWLSERAAWLARSGWVA